MPILETLSNLLGSWSPRSHRHPRVPGPDEHHSPLPQVHADAHSSEHLRRGLVFGGDGASSEVQVNLTGSVSGEGILVSGGIAVCVL